MSRKRSGFLVTPFADGVEALRAQIEELLGRRVYLDLHVRTAKDWQSDPKMLGRLGF